MSKVTFYTSQHCPYCRVAEQLLARRDVGPMSRIRVDLDPHAMRAMIEKTGRRTVPQIFIGARHVGGFDDLARLDSAGELETLLADC